MVSKDFIIWTVLRSHLWFFWTRMRIWFFNSQTILRSVLCRLRCSCMPEFEWKASEIHATIHHQRWLNFYLPFFLCWSTRVTAFFRIIFWLNADWNFTFLYPRCSILLNFGLFPPVSAVKYEKLKHIFWLSFISPRSRRIRDSETWADSLGTQVSMNLGLYYGLVTKLTN